jgi:hypothetical protein
MGRSLLVQETKVARGERPDVALAPHEAVESSSRESERCKSSKRPGVGATHGAPVQGHKVAKQVGGVDTSGYPDNIGGPVGRKRLLPFLGSLWKRTATCAARVTYACLLDWAPRRLLIQRNAGAIIGSSGRLM